MQTTGRPITLGFGVNLLIASDVDVYVAGVNTMADFAIALTGHISLNGGDFVL